MSPLHLLNLTSSTAASSAALWRGTSAFYRRGVTQPTKAIRLYEFENCPYCRMVRMALTELNINVDIYPCPKGGEVWRNQAKTIGGKAQFPLLVDENNDTVMYESSAIIEYLFTTYLGKVPNKWQPQAIEKLLIGSKAASTIRLGRGTHAKPSTQPKKLLTLYNFESSPFARPVRERLCELEIPYTLFTLGKEQTKDMGLASGHRKNKSYKRVAGGKREAMNAEHGHVSSPYLLDPNSQTKLPESDAIIAYLDKTYGA